MLVAGEGDLEGKDKGVDYEGRAHAYKHTEGLEEGLYKRGGLGRGR